MALVVTLILFALLIYGITKKINLSTLLLILSLVALIYLSVMGGSVLGEATTGSAFMDIFQFVANSISTNIAGMVLWMIVVIAYTEALGSMKATAKLTQLLLKPLSMIKKPYLTAGMVIVVGTLMRLGIVIGPAVCMLLIATVYPVLRAMGCSKATATSSTVLCQSIAWGPADTSCISGLGMMGLEADITSWFVSHQIILTVAFTAATVIAFIVQSRILDAKIEQEEYETAAQQGVDVPGYYALLPFLPLILMFLFSPFAISSIKISIVTAMLFSLLIAAVVHAITQRSVNAFVDPMLAFYESFGNTMKGLGIMVLFAMVFASCMNSIGGMQVIADALATVSLPPFVLALICAAFTMVVSFVVGSFYGALAMASVLATSILSITTIDPLFMCFLVVSATGAGCMLSPVNPIILLASSQTDLDPIELIKRNVVPEICGMLCFLIVGSLIFI